MFAEIKADLEMENNCVWGLSPLFSDMQEDMKW